MRGKGPWVIRRKTGRLAGLFFQALLGPKSAAFSEWTDELADAKRFATRFDATFEARHHLGLRYYEVLPVADLAEAVR